MTVTPFPRRRTRPTPPADGGPLRPGHHACLRNVAAGLVVHEGCWRWAWRPPRLGGDAVVIPQPRARYLDELAAARLVTTGPDGAVRVADRAA